MPDADDFLKQVSEVFTSGSLHDYIRNNTKHDALVIEDHLRLIASGGDHYYNGHGARLKASILLRKLEIMKEGAYK